MGSSVQFVDTESSSDALDDFCGGTFFNSSLLNGDWPQLTLCFQVTVLFWIPVGFLLIAFIPYSVTTWRRKQKNCSSCKTSFLYVYKLILSLSATLIAFLDSGESDQTAQAFVVGPMLRGISFLVTAIMIELDRKFGRPNNGYLCLFWLIQVFCGLIPFYSEIQEQTFSDYWHVSFYIQFGIWLLQLFLSNFAEDVEITPDMVSDKHKEPCPITKAPFFAYTTYQWLDPLMFKGWKKYLKEEDLWSLNPENKVLDQGERFQRLYAKEKAKQERKRMEYERKMQSSYFSNGFSAGPRGPEQRGYTHIQEAVTQSIDNGSVSSLSYFFKNKNGKLAGNLGPTFEPSVLLVLIKQYGGKILIAWTCKFFYDCLQFCNPQILNLVINFVNEGHKDDPLWQGIMYSFAFMLTAILSSQFFHQLFYISMNVGMNVKSAIISAVYRKALVMSNEAKKGSTVGEIVNLMSIDSDRLNLAIGYLWVLWSAPLQIVVALVLLWFQVKQAVFGGLAVIVLSIPLNYLLASFQKKLQVGQLKFKDRRIRQMGEILSGIKVIKLYAWEIPFMKRISGTRSREIEFLKKSAYLNGVNTFTWTFMPFLITLVTFMIYVYAMGEPLTSSKAFVTLSLFNILRAPLSMLPMLVAFLVQASVSLKRISKFLNNDEIDTTCVSHNRDDEYPIRMSNCDLSWNSDCNIQGEPSLTLSGINLKVKSASLTAVVGTVGAGKSSLISSLLGDLIKHNGMINMHGSVAYVSQQAWIQNLTVRENILFGKKFRKDKYDKVVEACALKPDLEILPGGDQTEIGEKGINLSGGQKQRVNIARAVYQNSDIYLFDDPLSAVDAHVGKHLFEHIVGPHGILKSKTRVLVTHGLAFLKHVDHVVFMKDGRIVEQGTFLDLLENCNSFKVFVQSANLTEDDKKSWDLEESGTSGISGVSSVISEAPGGRERSQSEIKRHEMFKAERKGKKRTRKRITRTISCLENDMCENADLKDLKKEAQDKDRQAEGRLTEKEVAEEGNIKWSIFVNYIRSIGVSAFCFSASLFMCYQAASIFAQIWLSQWSEWTDEQINKWPHNYSLKRSELNEKAGIYGLSGALQAGFILSYGVIFCLALVKATARLHIGLLDNIMRAPMSFFDSVPSGRIMNRFSKDVETTDNTLPQTVRSFLMTMCTVFQVFIIISYTTPIFLVFLVPLAILYYFIQRFYVKTSRQLKRVESTTRSPIFNQFSETLTGTSVIRAFRAEERFIMENHARVDENNIYYYAGSIVSARWLGIRLEFLGSLIVLAASLLAVLERDKLDSGLVGLAVSSSLQVTGALNWSVRMLSDLETYIVSVERLKEYTEIENEAPWERPRSKPPSEWPTQGEVEFKDYSTRYRSDLDLVLKGITFKVASGEKVGIVGRTGAGKSSLTLSLFRIIEAAGGSIEIDGVKVSELGLHDLRPKLTILPQDPVLFSGSLRENIDPFSHFDDSQLWESLQNAHLKDFAHSLSDGLNYDVGEGGANLSVGQRQLVCLARALLHKTMILILDEATAAVDLQTDALIQETIKVQFKECTVLTIAHRLNTIMDYDRVMVLSDGLIKEFDNPYKLMNDPSTQFHSMAVDAGLVQRGTSSSNGSSGSKSGSQHDNTAPLVDIETHEQNEQETNEN